jgi:PAS domain S-box-containing protein
MCQMRRAGQSLKEFWLDGVVRRTKALSLTFLKIPLPILGMSVLVFSAEILFPADYSIGFLYIPILLLGQRSRERDEVILVAILVTALSVVSYFIASRAHQDNVVSVAFNHCLTIGAIWWIVAFTNRHRGRSENCEGSRAAEDPTRLADAHLRTILEAAPEALVSVNEFGQIQSFSRSAEDLFGYASREIIGRNIDLLILSPHLRERNYVQELTHTNRSFTGLRRDGSIFPMEVSLGETVIGGRKSFAGLFRDMTSRQRMEQELRHAQKMDALSQLTGGIAHDFNNLLAVVIGNLEMLETCERLHKRDRLLVSAAQEAVRQGAKLTQRLMTFGRQQPLDSTLVDIGALVSDYSSSLRSVLGGQIEIRTVIRAGGCHALVDEPQLQNALLNLALNARDAMPQGGILTIDVSVTHRGSESASEQFVLLTISDTGAGMSIDVRQRAFDPFFTTKPLEVGAGLGLCMVEGFVRQSGGQIQLDSDLGRGTTVRIFLPSSGGSLDARLGDVGTATRRLHREKILVVGDDPSLRRVTVSGMRALGYAVIEAANASEALATLQRTPQVDLLFIDVVMLGDGSDLARIVKGKYPHIQILLTSGYARPELPMQLNLNGTRCLRRPYTASELARELHGLLSLSQMG